MTDRLATYDREAEEGIKSGQGRKSSSPETAGMRAALRTPNGRRMFASILNELYFNRSVTAATPEATNALAAVQNKGLDLSSQLKEADPEMFWLMLKENDDA